MGRVFNRKNVIFVLSVFLTLLIFLILFSQINRSQFLESLKNISIPLFIAAQLFLVVPFLLMAYRWKVMIKDYKDITLFEGARVFFLSQSFNVVTPSRIGDFGKAFFLRDKRFNLKVGAGAALLEKLLDFFALIVFSVAGIIIIKTDMGSPVLLAAMLTAIVLALIILFTVNFTKGPVSRLIRFMVPFRRLREIIFEMLSYFETLKKNRMRVLWVIILTLITWFMNFLQGYFLFWVIGYKISFFVAMGLMPLGVLAGMIPITVGGLGTRESAFVILFSAYAPAPVMLLFGLLFSLRYFLAAAAGLIWIKRYLH